MITISRLEKRFGTGIGAVNGISIQIPQGAFFSLVGPSGCGKTTTLRCVAGLEEPDAGEVTIGDTTVFSSATQVNVPTHRRSIGMVFQTYAIWPHMTVRQNVAYPLRNRHWSKERIRSAVAEILALVGLTEKADRPAPLLSGGEQQRVALARALVGQPSVLLLDEPLSNLDAKLREEMRFELRDLHDRMGFTALYVTHDQDEAFAMSDLIGIMQAGEIVEVGPPDRLYRSPATEFGAQFLGAATSVPGRAGRCHEPGRVDVDTTIGRVHCTMAQIPDPGTRVRVYIRPENVDVIDPHGGQTSDGIDAQLERTIVLGGHIDFWVSVNGVSLRGRALSRGSLAATLQQMAGKSVRVRIVDAAARVENGDGLRDAGLEEVDTGRGAPSLN